MYKTVEAQLIVAEDDGIIIEVILFARGNTVSLGSVKIPMPKEKETHVMNLSRVIPKEIQI